MIFISGIPKGHAGRKHSSAHSRRSNLGQNFVTLPSKRKVLLCYSAFIVRAELQGHLVESNVDIGMVIGLLGLLCDTVNELDALEETIEYEDS